MIGSRIIYFISSLFVFGSLIKSTSFSFIYSEKQFELYVKPETISPTENFFTHFPISTTSPVASDQDQLDIFYFYMSNQVFQYFSFINRSFC